ncbi:MAG: subclass B1 metallo-beta-lactamase [Acidiferrobacterales bacterium]|nr:subclass B1 metallo-beta-lactamase [Acidiferrobacterales bacterium]
MIRKLHSLAAKVVFAAYLMSLLACSIDSPPADLVNVNAKSNQANDQLVEFSQLADRVWLHTSYKYVEPWGLIPTNGLIVENENYSVLIDTAWNDAQTNQILNWANSTLAKPIKASIHTHAHADKMGGIEALHKQDVNTFAHSLSNQLAPQRDLIPARNNLPISEVGGILSWHGLTVLYPGGGHTQDNIVVYDALSQIIFGGCLVRPGQTKSLGFTGDANLEFWSQATQNVANAFPQAKIVIPSHGKPAGPEILLNTIEITKNPKSNL